VFPQLVLFDLDGTLLDSAPDFVATIAVLRSRRGHASYSPVGVLPPLDRKSVGMRHRGKPSVEDGGRR
jgi:phosphoglycolate phosphatase